MLDLCSRRLLGCAFSDHHDAALPEAALQIAVATRTGEGRPTRGVVFHSDSGSECTAATFESACKRLGVVQSMGRAGSAPDNAAAEAVSSSIKVELVHRPNFTTRNHARTEVSAWIGGFYNARRRQSACGGMSPVDYEHLLDGAPSVLAEEVAA